MECVQMDMNNVCRTCKNESPEMKSLYYRDSESGNSPRLDEMLMACASVQVNNEDGLPKLICQSCFVQLNNAYSFRELCEKTDLFLRDCLKNLVKKSIKEEEFTWNLIDEINSTSNDAGQIKDDKSIGNIKDEPESHSGESREKDVDYVHVVDSNLTIYECRICLKMFYTLEDLRCHKRIHTDNTEEYCMVDDFDDNTVTFSNQSDGDGGRGDDFIVTEITKPKVEVLESNDQEKIDEIAQITNESDSEEDPLQMLMKTKVEEEMYRVTDGANIKEEEPEIDNCNEYESDASTHSEYLPTKQTPPKIKRGPGRPRRPPDSFKVNGRSWGCPPPPELLAKPPENETDNFPCPQCKEVFTTMRHLEKHAEQHDGLQIHGCDSCNKRFTRWNNLKRHKLLHMEVRPFLCMTCKKCFTRKDHLRKHMKSHASIKTYSCDLCQEVFSRQGNLEKHKTVKHNTVEKIMEEKKKFVCSECGKEFVRNDYLVQHMRRHRGEKPFKCKLCGRGFIRTADLTVHMRYHTGEKRHLCGTCGRGFERSYDLTIHIRTHTGEKPHRCTYCDAAFAQGNDLRAHVRKHTGERFQCELCPKAFLIRYLLTQHKRVVHGLSIVSNQRRLQPINKLNPDDLPPIIVRDPLQLQQIEVSEVKQEQKSDIN